MITTLTIFKLCSTQYNSPHAYFTPEDRAYAIMHVLIQYSLKSQIAMPPLPIKMLLISLNVCLPCVLC